MSEEHRSPLIDFGPKASFQQMLDYIIRTDRHFYAQTGNGIYINEREDLVDLETRDDSLRVHYTSHAEVHEAIFAVVNQRMYGQKIIDDLSRKYPLDRFPNSYPTSAVLTHIFNDYFSSYRTLEEDTLFEGEHD